MQQPLKNLQRLSHKSRIYSRHYISIYVEGKMSMLCWGLSQQVILLKTKYMVEALIIFFITLVISVLKYKILIDVHMYLKLSENKY